MNKKDSIRIRGLVKMECHDKEGRLKWSTDWFHNGITNAGKAAIAGLVVNLGAVTTFSFIAVGTSNTAFGASQTALQAEITDTGLARAAATVTRVTTTVTNDTLQFVHVWTASGTKAVEEVGIFNDVSSGTMLGRALTTTKTVNNTETLSVTYKIIFS